MKYPAIFTPAEEGGFVVTFRDIPEAITQGDDEADALSMAADALVTSMEIYFDDRRQVPLPSKPLDGDRLIALPLSVAAKVLLLNEMLKQDVGPAEIGRRIGVSKSEATRLTDLHHSTKIDRIGDAMASLGRELDLVVR
jgi:antitoxin HicB